MIKTQLDTQRTRVQASGEIVCHSEEGGNWGGGGELGKDEAR